MSSTPLTLTAQMAAVAVVAAARAYGDDPAKAISPEASNQHRRSVAAAASALVSHTGQTAKSVCRLLNILDTSFYTARSKAIAPFEEAADAARKGLAEICDAYVRPARNEGRQERSQVR